MTFTVKETTENEDRRLNVTTNSTLTRRRRLSISNLILLVAFGASALYIMMGRIAMEISLLSPSSPISSINIQDFKPPRTGFQVVKDHDLNIVPPGLKKVVEEESTSSSTSQSSMIAVVSNSTTTRSLSSSSSSIPICLVATWQGNVFPDRGYLTLESVAKNEGMVKLFLFYSSDPASPSSSPPLPPIPNPLDYPNTEFIHVREGFAKFAAPRLCGMIGLELNSTDCLYLYHSLRYAELDSWQAHHSSTIGERYASPLHQLRMFTLGLFEDWIIAEGGGCKSWSWSDLGTIYGNLELWFSEDPVVWKTDLLTLVVDYGLDYEISLNNEQQQQQQHSWSYLKNNLVFPRPEFTLHMTSSSACSKILKYCAKHVNVMELGKAITRNDVKKWKPLETLYMDAVMASSARLAIAPWLGKFGGQKQGKNNNNKSNKQKRSGSSSAFLPKLATIRGNKLLTVSGCSTRAACIQKAAAGAGGKILASRSQQEYGTKAFKMELGLVKSSGSSSSDAWKIVGFSMPDTVLQGESLWIVRVDVAKKNAEISVWKHSRPVFYYGTGGGLREVAVFQMRDSTEVKVPNKNLVNVVVFDAGQ